MPGTIRIAGAGLSGLVAAVTLAEAGYPVEVFEKKRRLLPSSGPHTEGIRNYRPIDAINELRSFGFDIPPFSVVTRTYRYSSRYRNLLTGQAHYLFVRGREESTVDQRLYRKAKKAGVQFHFSHEVDASDADIVATGPPKDRFSVLGAGYTFTAAGSSLHRNEAHALFDNNVAPAGYLVITPGVKFHSIYSVSWKELRYDVLLSMTERAFDLPWIRRILGTSKWADKIHGRAFYERDPIASAIRNGSLYVGEAGGFQDAVAGFGFRYAVITGALAARALRDGQDYRDLLRSVFADELAAAFEFRRRLDRATNDDYDRMIASLGPEIRLEEYVRRREPRGF